ncbi:hypothetical protein ACNKF0_09450 [Nocardioides sp. T5]|uniref:hypothetical protein n=1 Tax=Nocardioides sp. T5 TaxID=3400182 RepID=UPI003A872259
MVSEGDPNADDRETEALRAELAEAKRIGRWLYDRAPGLRLLLGDVSEWPWLVDEPNVPREPAPRQLAEADHDQAVLRTFAVIQASGDNPYDAEDVASTLGLSPEEFDDSIYRLLQAGLVTGGRLMSGAFVDTVTAEGMAAAGMLDHDGRPLLVLRTDLASFTGAGHGTVRLPDGMRLSPGQTIVLTDEEADPVEAEVLAAEGTSAHVRARWHRQV